MTGRGVAVVRGWEGDRRGRRVSPGPRPGRAPSTLDCALGEVLRQQRPARGRGLAQGPNAGLNWSVIEN